MDVEKRIAIEKRIVRRLIAELLTAGFALSVDNGGDGYEIVQSTDKKAIFAVMLATDDEAIIAEKPGIRGWVRLVYGNDGYDVIADYTVNIEKSLTDTLALADEIEAREG